jgi:hypothetical protein
MKIRQANKFDVPRLVELMKHYREQSPLACLLESDNVEHVEALLAQILAGRGTVIVADHEGLVVGMLIAMINPNIWDPNIICLNELAWWVEPEHRNTSAGYKLLLEYSSYGERLEDEGKINYYTISKMVNSPDLKYERFGFNKLEEMWSS